MSESNQKRSGMLDNKTQFNALVFIVNAWATSLEVVLHKGFGSRYLGLNALGAFFLIPFFLVLIEGHSDRPIFFFWLAFIACWAVHRWAYLWRSSPPIGHSFYTGWPRLLPKQFETSELKFKQLHEPTLVMAIGFAMLGFSPPLGTYLLIGSFCLWMKVRITEFLGEQRSLDLNDSVIEQEILAERFRKSRNGHAYY